MSLRFVAGVLRSKAIDSRARIALAEDLEKIEKIEEVRAAHAKNIARYRAKRLKHEATPQQIAELRHQSNLSLDRKREEIGYTDAKLRRDQRDDQHQWVADRAPDSPRKSVPWYLIPPEGADPALPLADRLDGVQLDWIHDNGLFKANVTMESTARTRYGARGESMNEGCE